MPAILTPTDLKSWRISLGLDVNQAAALYDVLPSTVKAIERGRQKKVFQNWIDKLSQLEDSVQDYIDHVSGKVGRDHSHVMLVYPSDESFDTWEPSWFEHLHFASVHAMAGTNMKFEMGYPITLVEFSEGSYWKYVEDNKLPRDEDHRLEWAIHYLGRYSILKREEPKPDATNHS